METRYQKILITGASTGIGRQLALDYGKMGASVWLLARRESLLLELVRDVEALGGQAHVLVCDATHEAELMETFKQAQASSGGFDLVVANAGWGGKMKYPGENNIKVFNQVLDLNFKAAVQTLEFFAYYMVQAKHGHLVGITSIAGFRGLPGNAAYSSTKAALQFYLEALRFSLQPFGVKVTDIRPGFVRTPLTNTNKIPMPFLMDVDRASQKIIGAIERGRKRFTFPWQMAMFVHLIRVMPAFLFDWVAGMALGDMAVKGREGKSEQN